MESEITVKEETEERVDETEEENIFHQVFQYHDIFYNINKRTENCGKHFDQT